MGRFYRRRCMGLMLLLMLETTVSVSLVVQVVAAVLIGLVPTVQAAVSCNATHNPCEELLWKGSECRNGVCSNPFEQGCLRALLQQEKYETKYSYNETAATSSPSSSSSKKLSQLFRRLKSAVRVCNSEDPPDAAARGICRTPSEHYLEIRIHSQDWESAFFNAWILQIMLSEILLIPTSIETSSPTAKVNFYHPTNAVEYGTPNDVRALENAYQHEDCAAFMLEQQQNDPSTYAPCAHVVPEVWGFGIGEVAKLQDDGVIEPPEAIGAIGFETWYVTKFTVVEDPTLVSFVGLSGEANRRKLADTFKRPTRWNDYCELVSEDGCATPDEFASRAPQDDEEGNRMFVPGVYTGHFRYTEKNDCDKNPTTCTGHIADFPCGWGSFVLPQTYHHNIALESDGTEPVVHGYTYGDLVDIWAAANATRSNLVGIWWSPNSMYSSFIGTDTEMTPFSMPPATQTCVDQRVNAIRRCEFDEGDPRLYGEPEGACGDTPFSLQKIVVANLESAIYERSNMSPTLIGPAYDVIKAYKISELQLEAMTSAVIERDVDKDNFDPRFATCQWVADNLEYLESFIPDSYPRIEEELQTSYSPLFYVAVTVSVITTIMVMVAFALTYRFRNRLVMKFAQVDFLYLLLAGLFLVAVGSIMVVVEPSNVSCIMTSWLITVGYTLELAPLIVKVYGINKLVAAAMSMRRLQISRTKLFGVVFALTGVAAVYCTVWTALDPPRRQAEYELTDEETDYGETVVVVSYHCNSQSDAWNYASGLWHCLLLVCATVLAFEMHNIKQRRLNETQVLAMMIYSHFVFVVLRMITFLLEDSVFASSSLTPTRSLIYSLDTMAAITIYFVPKFVAGDRDPTVSDSSSRSKLFYSGRFRRRSTRRSNKKSASRVESIVQDDGAGDASFMHSNVTDPTLVLPNFSERGKSTRYEPSQYANPLPRGARVDSTGCVDDFGASPLHETSLEGDNNSVDKSLSTVRIRNTDSSQVLSDTFQLKELQADFAELVEGYHALNVAQRYDVETGGNGNTESTAQENIGTDNIAVNSNVAIQPDESATGVAGENFLVGLSRRKIPARRPGVHRRASSL